MKNTIIQVGEDYINIMEFIELKLGSEYKGSAQAVSCEDFAIPQARKRLITVYSRSESGVEYFNNYNKFFLEMDRITFNNKITLRDAIGHLPPLDSKKGENMRLDIHPYYFVNVMAEDRYSWVDNTPSGESAFNNQCVNNECRYQFNKRHGTNNIKGKHTTNKDTPLYCIKCGSLLPRPSTKDRTTGELRLIKGYDTTYARMEWDKPASTLTQNFQYDSSGRHYHPEQNRVLSVYEGLILQTITEYPFILEINGELINKNTMAEIIGESVPPKLIDLICKKLIKLRKRKFSLRKSDMSKWSS